MGRDLEVDLSHKVDLEEPRKYKVLMLNDNYSTMDFVVEVLIKIFKKSTEESMQIMLNIHNHGKEVCGVYTQEIAATKCLQVRNVAREKGFPLKAVMEEA
jgi:ATP-dependent Clp protease adaptor protein ClpS